jgi:hypothetical protein
MLCWSSYFSSLFRAYNPKKDVTIITFGNSIFNRIDRSAFTYNLADFSRILLAPSLVKGTRLELLKLFGSKMQELGFDVHLKTHNFQKRFGERIDGFQTVNGSLYDILKNGEYDIVVADQSSSLLDAIMFKCHVMFFSPLGEFDYYQKNIYAQFLKNAADHFQQFSSQKDVIHFLDVNAQERLFNHLVFSGTNIITNLN